MNKLPLLCFALAAAASLWGAEAARLRCEYRLNPDGIGETHPRLGWIMTARAGERGVRQSAYRVLVASSRELLAQDKGDRWDSGKVTSDQMQQIAYAGRPLGARQQCWWKVQVWDQAGREGAWSEPAYWSTGLLDAAGPPSPGSGAASWQAEWIGLDAGVPTDGTELDAAARERIGKQAWIYSDENPSTTAPRAMHFRGRVVVPAERKLAGAVFALTADQVGVITINGKPAGTVTRWEQLKPQEATALFATGENVIDVEVTQRDGYPPALLGEVRLTP